MYIEVRGSHYHHLISSRVSLDVVLVIATKPPPGPHALAGSRPAPPPTRRMRSDTSPRNSALPRSLVAGTATAPSGSKDTDETGLELVSSLALRRTCIPFSPSLTLA